MGKFTEQLNTRMKTKPSYLRHQYQSYMTGPEWRNVEMAEEFAAFAREGNSIFQFPYFRQIADLWRVISRSYSAARKYNSHWQILTSEYMLMDVFIGVFTTLELIPKGILSLILYPFLKKENNTEMQGKIANYFAEYARNLQTIPFYDHKYQEKRAELAQAYQECGEKTWVDWFSWKCLSIELWARHWISKPLHYWFHQEDNLVEPTTDIIVKYRAEGEENREVAIQQFQRKVEEVGERLHTSIVDQLYTREKKPKRIEENEKGREREQSSTYVYARLKAPRYAAFQETVQGLAEQGIYLRKIAGQEQVQVKCVVEVEENEDGRSVEQQLEEKISTLDTIPNTTPLYTYGDRIHNQRRVCLFDVPVKDLHHTLEEFDQKGAEVKFIHNF